MLDPPVNLREQILFELNRTENLAAWQALLDSDDAHEHRERERTRYDTTFSAFHHNGRAFVNDLLGHTRYRTYVLPGATLLGVTGPAVGARMSDERWLACVDVFALWTREARDPKSVRKRVGKRPFSAVRIGASVFYLSGKGKLRWRWRRWRGTDHDPLMRLPYQRKYDSERHHFADQRQRWYAQRIRIADDLLYVLEERVEDLDVSDGEFRGLELADIQEELGRMGLGLSGADLLLPAGVELCQIRMQYREGRPREPRIDFTIAEGRYDGVLGGYHRRPSGALRRPPSAAGEKWILTRAIARLRESLEFLVAAPGDQRAILDERTRTLGAPERGA